MLKNKNGWIYVIASLIVFILLGVFYANPVLSGKELIQPDIVHYRGGAQEMLNYRAETGHETYWSDAMFGGMPTYQTGAEFRGDLIRYLDRALNFLPKPVNYLFLLFAGFFLLGMVVLKDWRYALLGATFFGLSTYFYIIIGAGHNAKVHAIAYFAPLLAGILLVYIRKKYLWGFVVTAIFMGLEIEANHPQMTYYLFLGLAIFFLYMLWRAIFKTKDYKHFITATVLVGFAMVLGLGMNAQRIMANAQYVKETVRGKQILSNQSGKKSAGLDKDYITAWSYGKIETLDLLIPRLMGGGSEEPGSDKIMQHIQELVHENARSQAEVDNISKGLTSLTYWGTQPGTSGPAYEGAVVVFLAFLGFFFAKDKYRWWILGATILTILLAWGHNFATLTNFFIDHVPFYDKFRAPSSILVVVELLLPLIAILGLHRFLVGKELKREYKQKVLLYSGGGFILFILILILFGKGLLGFHTENEARYFPPYLLNYLEDARYSMFRTDAIKAIIYIAITAGALWMVLKQKLNRNMALLIIGVVSLFDLWTVNRRYLNNDNFVNSAFAQHPFLTENSDAIEDMGANSSYVSGLVQQIPVNKMLETIAEHDKSHYRVFNTVLNPFNETNTSFFVNSIGGYTGARLRRYDDLMNQYLSNGVNPNILNLLNTKYVITADSTGIQPQINPGANGPAWFVSKIQFVKTPNEEINALGKIDNKTTAVIPDSEKPYFKGKNIAADATARIELKDYQPNEIVYQTTSKTPQLAVMSEIYYPYGWKFYIDGKEVPYVRADYLLRAVYVPQGKHEIRMVFKPKVIAEGRTLSYASVGVFLLLIALGYWFFEKKKKPASAE